MAYPAVLGGAEAGVSGLDLPHKIAAPLDRAPYATIDEIAGDVRDIGQRIEPG